jgi:type IV pilus assembly protein PilW
MMQSAPLTHSPRKTTARGFSLVELLVAVAIGMVLVILITTLIARQEANRRTLTAGNEASLSGSYASYTLDREIRSAGSGFSHNRGIAYGCALNVSRNNAQRLPSIAAFPAPFDSLPQNPFLAPVVVHAGLGAGGSDLIVVNSGTSGIGEIGYQLRPLAAAVASLQFETTIGIKGNDLVLVFDPSRGCVMQQVQTGFLGSSTVETLPLGGAYYAATINSVALSSYATGRLSVLGNVVDNPPRFTAIGLGTNGRLFSYDLLNIDGTNTPQIVADGVVDLRVRYGVDTDGDSIINAWVAPDNATYTPAALAANPLRISQIVALRVGMVVSGDLVEKDDVSPATLTLFSALPAGPTHTVALSTEQRRLRTRVIEFTVPVRNAISINRR